jgi:hypothetical protein
MAPITLDGAWGAIVRDTQILCEPLHGFVCEDSPTDSLFDGREGAGNGLTIEEGGHDDQALFEIQNDLQSILPGWTGKEEIDSTRGGNRAAHVASSPSPRP